MSNSSQAATPWRRAQPGVIGVFFVAGAVIATWVSYIPLIQRRLGLSEAELGGALFAMTAGALCAVVAAGGLIERFGSRRVTAAAGAVFCLLLPAPVFAPSFPLLAVALFAFGAVFGAMDVAMNAQAAQVQRAATRPLMSRFHGLYSLGGMAGAAVAGTLLSLEVSAVWHAAGIVGSMLLLCVGSAARLLETPPRDRSGGPGLALPLGPLVGMSLLAFVVFVGEGAVMDWANVYLANVIGADPGRAASGFAAFSTAMATGRFMGDWATARWGASRFAIVSAGLGAAGLAVALSTEALIAAAAGFALAGLGFANLIPILFTQAAEATPEAPQQGIAGVAGVGYFGLVAGPPVIGFTAEAIGLRGALWLVAAAMALAAVLLPSAFRAAKATPRQ